MRTLLRAIPPAIYLACSWCWVIGMLLPVLLVRDFGVWGWAAFAVPNVIGAGAVGWYAAGASARRLVERHRVFIAAFSWWTIIFHATVLVIIVSGPTGELWFAVAMMMLWLVAPSRLGLIAAVAMGLSVLTMIEFAGERPIVAPPTAGERSAIDLAFASVSLAFGFLLCPALDRTFLDVGDEQRGGSRLAFVVGFGVFFPVLIAFAGVYAHTAIDFIAEPTRRDGPPERLFGQSMVLAFIAGQAVFTCGAHAASGRRGAPQQRVRRRLAWVLGIVLVAAVFSMPQTGSGSSDTFWLVYRLFLSAYALPFPAYVFICMIPWRWSATPRRRLVVCGVATLAAAPFLAVGYFGDVYALLPIGVLIPLAAPFLAGARPQLSGSTASPAYHRSKVSAAPPR